MLHKRIIGTDLDGSNGLARPRLRKALESVRPAMAALKPAELLVVNVDPAAAVETVRGALPALLAMRSQIASELIRFDLNYLDMLETYALALTQAHAICSGIESKSKELQHLSNEANSLRGRLLSDLQALVSRGCISSARLTGLHGPNGHRNIASDLLTIMNVLRDNWGSISGMTATTEEDLIRAESLGDRILGLISTRKQRTKLATTAHMERQRVYTLFMLAYSQARRAATYLRWNDGDVERLAPTVYRRRHLQRGNAEKHARPVASEQELVKTEPLSISDNESFGMSDSLTVDTEPVAAAPKNDDSKSVSRMGLPGSKPALH